jgi:hypothetical protein
MSPYSRVPFQTLDVLRGSKVLDVGCGWGDTAIELARKTGPEGWCLTRLLRRVPRKGRADARGAGSGTSASSRPMCRPTSSSDFDLCFALRDMRSSPTPSPRCQRRSALRPAEFTGLRRLADDRRQPVFGMPKRVVLEFLPPPGEDAATCGPGPFSMASPDVVGAAQGGYFIDATSRASTDR